MTANHVPSMIWSIAAAAASRAARMLTAPIDPDVSTMTISPASPSPAWPAAPAPVQVTVTMAGASVPPSGRNSFWETSAVKSAISSGFLSGGAGCGGIYAGQCDRDVVLATLGVGPVNQCTGEGQGLSGRW